MRETHTIQRNTEADPSGLANMVAPYINLADVQHEEKAVQEVGMQTTKKGHVEIPADQ